jgi:hypothetical protein
MGATGWDFEIFGILLVGFFLGFGLLGFTRQTRGNIRVTMHT